MTRLLILLVAALFIVGFAFLTISDIAARGFTLGSAVSIAVIVLMAIGILGPLLNPPRR
jgi:hypothetical protein